MMLVRSGTGVRRRSVEESERRRGCEKVNVAESGRCEGVRVEERESGEGVQQGSVVGRGTNGSRRLAGPELALQTCCECLFQRSQPSPREWRSCWILLLSLSVPAGWSGGSRPHLQQLLCQ